MVRTRRPVFVLYVPGLDRRRIDGDRAPYLSRLLARHPTVEIRTLPDVDLTPSLMTGVLPDEHGVWQVRIGEEGFRRPGWRESLIDAFPDLLTTTVQGVAHALTGNFDLAAVPPRRRRRFEMRRFKYERREKGWLEPSSSTPSIFRMIENENDGYRYHLASRFSELEALLPELPTATNGLEWLELYAFDLTEHWNLDRPTVMDEAINRVDRAARELHRDCKRHGIRFLLLSDHGQEPVKSWFDLVSELERLNIHPDDYAYFMEPVYARFWFRTERARRTISDHLAALDSVTTRTYREMHRYGVKFPAGDFGELYAYARPGSAFFPHDFYQPLANAYMALTHPEQRSRLLDPRHRGCHGYLPDSPSERGFLNFSDGDVELRRAEIQVTDVAPTVLHLLDEPVPDYMPDSAVLPL